MRRKSKCIAWSKSSLYCDGCNRTSSKCPYRDKYRDLRHTKYGDAKYHPYKNEKDESETINQLHCPLSDENADERKTRMSDEELEEVLEELRIQGRSNDLPLL